MFIVIFSNTYIHNSKAQKMPFSFNTLLSGLVIVCLQRKYVNPNIVKFLLKLFCQKSQSVRKSSS